MTRLLAGAVIIVALLAGSSAVTAQARFRRAEPAARATGPTLDSATDGRTAEPPRSTAALRVSRLKFAHGRVLDQRRLHIPFGLGGGSFAYVPLWHFVDVAPEQADVAAPRDAPLGGIQLDVEPREAEVYVDGAYAGVVSEFSGYYRNLELGAGAHVITIIARNYEPLIVHVVVSPHRTTTYRNSLARAYGR